MTIQTLEDLKNKKVFILGLGKTGDASAQFCAFYHMDVYAWDESSDRRHDMTNVNLQDPKDIAFSKDWYFMKSPGIADDHDVVQKARDAGVTFLSDVDLLYLRHPKATFIGVTGTNGKSTTTALLGHLLQQADYDVAVGGNIGTAALALPSVGSGGIYVLEMSSYQLEHTKYIHFNRAAIINLSPDHLERHGDMVGYLAAKANIFKHQQSGDISVLGVDCPELETLAVVLGMDTTTLRRVTVENKVAEYMVNGDGILKNAKGEKIANLTLAKNLPGKHNWQNSATAWALLEGLITREQFARSIESFPGLAHRLKTVKQLGDVRFVDDSKATNPEAAICALKSFEKNVLWIAGGQPKAEGLGDCVKHLDAVDCLLYTSPSPRDA